MTTIESHPHTAADDLESGGLRLDPSWVSEAPLKLVASALECMGDRTGKPGAIKETLEAAVDFKPKWGTWWKRVKPLLEDSEHFEVEKGQTIRLLTDVAGIEFQPLPSPAKKLSNPGPRKPSKQELQWLAWLTEENGSAPPSRSPTKAAHAALGKCPDQDLRQALDRICGEASSFLDSNRTAPKVAAGWASLMSSAASRWRDGGGVYSGSAAAESVGELLARLIGEAKSPRESREWLRQAGGLLTDSQLDTWRGQFAIGVWRSLNGSRDGARAWFESLFYRSAGEERMALVREITLAAFNGDSSNSSHIQLERLLNLFSPADRIDMVRDIIIQSAAGGVPKHRVLAFTEHVCYSGSWPEPAGRLNLLVLAATLLSDGEGPIPSRASEEIGVALMDGPIHEEDEVWSSLLSAARQQVAGVQASWKDQLDEQRARHEESHRKLLAEKNGQDKLVNELRAEIERNREQSKLEILEDILKVIAEKLQLMRLHADSPDEMLSEAEAGFALALRVGGAQELGKVGEIVQYEPSKHKAEQDVSIGAQVRISQPGALVPGKLTGGLVLLRARVEPVVEVE